MSQKKSISFSFFLLLLISVFAIPNSKAYYGDGDCTIYHEGKTIQVPHDPSAIIQLDGLSNESFWNDSENSGGKTQINVSTSLHAITTLNMSFVRNDEYLLISCEWNDITTLPSTRDGFYICWNINAPNFSSYYPGGMDTSHMGGGYIDSWLWYINNLDPVNDSNEYCKDQSFGPSGDTGENDQITVEMGYSTFVDSHYSIEIRRRLTTADPTFDVQFDRTKKYEFNLGIINDTSLNHEHAISYTHALEMSFPIINGIPGYPVIPLFLGIGFVSVIFIYRKYDYNKKK